MDARSAAERGTAKPRKRTHWGWFALLFFGGLTTYGVMVPAVVIGIASLFGPEAVELVRRPAIFTTVFGCAWLAMALATGRHGVPVKPE